MQLENKNVLVTGGAGYIGSHVCLFLKKNGFIPISFDNLSTGHKEAIKFGPFFEGDLLNKNSILSVLEQYNPVGVIHLASYIQVAESVKNPLKYHKNNFVTSLNLFECMIEKNVSNLVFSSSAAVYGIPSYTPIDEEHPCNPINPYGATKRNTEILLKELDIAHGFKSLSLRYFNAAGATPDEGIGEAHEPETHLIPLIIQGAMKEKEITIFGNDYPTPDGTCTRDYIHVRDLAHAHVLGLRYLISGGKTDFINLGLGKEFSNLEIVNLIQRYLGKPLKPEFKARRSGDPTTLLASISKARNVLGWAPVLSIENIIEDAYKWELERSFV